MAQVITQMEIMKFAGMEKAVFPADTILTPSAKDWAQEHKIDIILGKGIDKQSDEKSELLKNLVKAVIKNMDRAGGFLKKEELVEVVTRCLEKMGNTVGK
ncbi:hypothetical protein DFR58_106183 [Anaerobacterium chartisolvens]|uniref:Uncharacterized protein n=1 Tax=Anaerobacterium chartisolvens TaxID=1297424 RepID=A0A369BEB4_9FIRM|nr:hypothetical protein [Anaerobacterium chartisolvens]RCX18014.1 hypothetical protein DFR58_106183 [Anaerobacterium chartisolvens]